MSTSEVIKLKNVRLSFPRLWKAKAFREGQEPRFEASFLLDPSDKAQKAIIKEIKSVAKSLAHEQWGEKIPATVEHCFGMADKDKVKREYDGYPGMFFIAASNQTRPTVVDRDRSPLAEEDGKPYAGCIVTGTITLWTMDNEFGKRINANLRGIQFVKDGEAFGAKPVDAENEFDVIDEDDDDDIFDD
jgi:hypothetical protein